MTMRGTCSRLWARTQGTLPRITRSRADREEHLTASQFGEAEVLGSTARNMFTVPLVQCSNRAVSLASAAVCWGFAGQHTTDQRVRDPWFFCGFYS